jgi:hypothetical protein
MDLLPTCSSIPIGLDSSPPSTCSAQASRTRSHRGSPNGRNYEATFVSNAVAAAVISRLHRWCCQLFWLTIVCVIGCCGDIKELQGAGKQKTLKHVRRSLVQSTQRSRTSMMVTELEMQLLRHLTCPPSAGSSRLRPTMGMRGGSAHRRKHHLSRPPSPQLFDIREEELE